MPQRLPLTAVAQEQWQQLLLPGDWVIDATAGNGFDTACLARCVGPTGRVFAIDVQERAIQSAAALLEKEDLFEQVTLVRGSHAALESLLPCAAGGRFALACFNLGYLPNGDHRLKTQPESTLSGLDGCHRLLKPGAYLSVITYRGHPGGLAEAEAVGQYIRAHPEKWKIREFRPTGTEENPGPVWWLLHRCD